MALSAATSALLCLLRRKTFATTTTTSGNLLATPIGWKIRAAATNAVLD